MSFVEESAQRRPESVLSLELDVARNRPRCRDIERHEGDAHVAFLLLSASSTSLDRLRRVSAFRARLIVGDHPDVSWRGEGYGKRASSPSVRLFACLYLSLRMYSQWKKGGNTFVHSASFRAHPGYPIGRLIIQKSSRRRVSGKLVLCHFAIAVEFCVFMSRI